RHRGVARRGRGDDAQGAEGGAPSRTARRRRGHAARPRRARVGDDAIPSLSQGAGDADEAAGGGRDGRCQGHAGGDAPHAEHDGHRAARARAIGIDGFVALSRFSPRTRWGEPVARREERTMTRWNWPSLTGVLAALALGGVVYAQPGGPPAEVVAAE